MTLSITHRNVFSTIYLYVYYFAILHYEITAGVFSVTLNIVLNQQEGRENAAAEVVRGVTVRRPEAGKCRIRTVLHLLLLSVFKQTTDMVFGVRCPGAKSWSEISSSRLSGEEGSNT